MPELYSSLTNVDRTASSQKQIFLSGEFEGYQQELYSLIGLRYMEWQKLIQEMINRYRYLGSGAAVMWISKGDASVIGGTGDAIVLTSHFEDFSLPDVRVFSSAQRVFQDTSRVVSSKVSEDDYEIEMDSFVKLPTEPIDIPINEAGRLKVVSIWDEEKEYGG